MGTHQSKARKKNNKQDRLSLRSSSPPIASSSALSPDTITETTSTSTTSAIISEDPNANGNNGAPRNNEENGNKINEGESVARGEIHVDENVLHQCTLCKENYHEDKFYILEACGHGFCIPCIHSYSEEKLKDISPDCHEVVCPVKDCNCAISVADFKKAMAEFGNPPNHNHQHPNEENHPVENNVELNGANIEPETKQSVTIQLSASLELILSKTNYIHCPNPSCKFVFERLVVSSGRKQSIEVVLDEEGKPISSAAMKHREENRFRCRNCDVNFCAACKTIPYHLGFTCKQYLYSLKAKHCRFCDVVLPAGTKAHPYSSSYAPGSSRKEKKRKDRSISFINLRWKKEKSKQKEKESSSAVDMTEMFEAPKEFFVCKSAECNEKINIACLKYASCNHCCVGVRFDSDCIGCINPACLKANTDVQTSEDFCNICWVQGLGQAPCVKLLCGHVFHYECVKQKLDMKWPTISISFAFANCPLCQARIQSSLFSSELAEINSLYEEVKTKALNRLEIEDLKKDPQITTPTSPYFNKPAEFAMHIFSFYLCAACRHPYFGGRRQCEEGENVDMSKHNPKDLICGGCSTLNAECKIHGKEYIDYKCRFCCSLATYFCGGKAHFCNPCHEKAGKLVEFANWTTIAKLDPCKGPDQCPLGIPHPENGEEFSLGCAMCKAGITENM